MVLTIFNNKTPGGDEWCGKSFFAQQPARENSHQSIKNDTKNTKHFPVQFHQTSKSRHRELRLKKVELTPKKGIRSVRNQSAQSHAQKQSRTQSVRGAANISKETRLLKSKLDRLFASYQETVVAASQSNVTQLESLRAENQQLRIKLEELETETLRQFSELEEYEELMAAIEGRRLSSQKEASMWKLECNQLANEVELLKTTIAKHNQRTRGCPQLRFRNEEKEKESLSNAKVAKTSDFEVNERRYKGSDPIDSKVESVRTRESCSGSDCQS